jgi:hypothetical protein
MAKGSNIVHQYFKKQLGDSILLVKVNPLQFKVTEITVHKNQDPELREMEADEGIFEDLKADGFTEASPLEFNLYLSGLIS